MLLLLSSLLLVCILFSLETLSLFPYFRFSLWRWSCRPKVIGQDKRLLRSLGVGSTGQYKYDSFNEQKHVAGLLALSFLNTFSQVFETLDFFN